MTDDSELDPKKFRYPDGSKLPDGMVVKRGPPLNSFDVEPTAKQDALGPGGTMTDDLTGWVRSLNTPEAMQAWKEKREAEALEEIKDPLPPMDCNNEVMIGHWCSRSDIKALCKCCPCCTDRCNWTDDGWEDS